MTKKKKYSYRRPVSCGRTYLVIICIEFRLHRHFEVLFRQIHNHYISRFFYPKYSVWTQTEVEPVDSDYVTCWTTCWEVLQNRRLKYERAHVAKCCATDVNKRRIHETSCIIKVGTACKCMGRGNSYLIFLWGLN